MTLVSMREVISSARDRGHGVGSFNIITLEHLEAIVAGASSADSAVVLQVSENTVDYHGSPAPLLLASLTLARQADVPVVVHLDHATRPELVDAAVELGVASVMFDASALDYQANVESTARVVQQAHERGVWVEAELGEVGGKDGVHAAGARTDPEEALAYVEATGVDSLAVAVGSSHAMLTRDAVLDDELIARLARRVPVPLVLHGSSGVPDGGLRSAVAAGITKVNIATHLNSVMTAQVRSVLADQPALVDPRRYLGPARTAVAAEVTRLLEILGSTGSARP